ncbi:MAG: radical SAM protein [Candidatus Eisenbacteria sp.]|nr:radical SAM protein [Candidatus Eisenbacteria bacterium]
MTIVRSMGKAVAYGKRHLMQDLDYSLGGAWSKPDKVTIRLTQRCNARCLMCDFWQTKTREEDEIPTSRWIALVEELHDWIGPHFLSLTGGEIFLKPGIYDLLKRIAELDISLTILSNGLALRSERHLSSLLESGVRSLNLSIDGFNPEIHDKFRGVNGIHAAAVEAIREIKRRKPEMVITAVCIIMRDTIGQLVDYVKWAEDLSIDRVLFQPIMPTLGGSESDRLWYKTSERFVRDRAQVRRIMAELETQRQNNSIIANGHDEFRKFQEYFENPNIVQIHRTRCMLGQTNLNIDEFGKMDMCYAFDTRIGNVNDGPLKKTWTSALARQKRREIKECRRPCVAACYRSFSLAEKIRLFFKYSRMGKI